MSKALTGMKVLDLSMNLPGPYMTWLLAAMGADVVKIENPLGGDYARALGASADNKSPFFEAVNRNKKSVTLNLKHAEGRGLFLRLLEVYDVLVDGFRPGTLERLGLGFETIREKLPRLICVSISGYGQESPYRLRAGHDLNYLSLAGIIGMTGAQTGEPAIPGVQIADLAGGSLMGLAGLLAAVLHREKTGQGQFVDIAMFDGALSLATMIFGAVQAGLEDPAPGKMLLNGRLPCYGLYSTADGRHMSLGALEFKFWENFCAAVGRNDLLGSQFGGPEIVDRVRDIFASRTQQDWIALMRDHDACCEPVLTLRETAETDLVKARSMVRTGADGLSHLGCPIKLSESPAQKDVPAPALGQHTHEVLSQLGLSAEKLESLGRQGVI